jgi:predicted permease
VILPDPLASAVELLSGAMLPLVLLALGLGLELSLPKKDRAPLAVGLALKLLVLPALVLGALVLSGERGEPAQVALLESAMPPMVTAGALAAGQKLAPELSRAMTGVGLILAMVTLPLFSWIGALLLGG